ncbi:prepilin-type N-terminal cleavage/methylation domain-containing protein [Corallococcus macrosporus]|uniref:Prepilin-type N-terminal cleavage/methylation domain-containing protein n=1 Tax=Corallococcus macrosporus TaxID=35 RepID=A0ABS3D8M9_9BACT|nr:prepilin-type N-terminal cleavage/methylation domain-containing protein [Corallococcus macrosporus]MBN8228018.1 prepilin-type N-terminal cleavage/methylation domain-containing protein [Corallococcus macrosporus]
MRRGPSVRRGFTLLELMIGSALSLVLLAMALGASVQLQRRSVLEQQTMLAQVTGRALKEFLVTELSRVGAGMGNATLVFSQGDVRQGLTVWTAPDLSLGRPPLLAADPGFALPPTGGPYAGMASDALQLWWGDSRGMIALDDCAGGKAYRVREGGAERFCTAPAPATELQPVTGQTTPAFLVNASQVLACHVEVRQVQAATQEVTAIAGTGTLRIQSGPCADAQAALWEEPGWLLMRAQGSSYRVNWATGDPVLEYLPAGATTWTTVSRDVEQLKVRQGLIDLSQPQRPLRWFPDAAAGRPGVDGCTLTQAACAVDTGPTDAPEAAPTSDAELRRILQERVRSVEVTLVVRSPRRDLSAVQAGTTDDEGFPKDGYRRRTLTFRVSLRNQAVAGRVP